MSNRKYDWLKIVPLIKNLQFSSNQADILPKVPIFELVILVEYQLDWMKNADFLLIAYF